MPSDPTPTPMQVGQLRCRAVRTEGPRSAYLEFYNAATGKAIGKRTMTVEEYDEWEADGFPEAIPIGVEMDTRGSE